MHYKTTYFVSSDGGPLLGAKRDQMLDDLIEMAKKKLIDKDDVAFLTAQTFKMNGKNVTFTNAFLKGKGLESPTGQRFTELLRVIRANDIEKEQLRQQELSVARQRFIEDQFRTYNQLGRTITRAEAIEGERKWNKNFPGEAMPEQLKKLYSLLLV